MSNALDHILEHLDCCDNDDPMPRYTREQKLERALRRLAASSSDLMDTIGDSDLLPREEVGRVHRDIEHASKLVDRADTETWLVVEGNPKDGFHFTGPFNTQTEAAEHADGLDSDWWTVEVYEPKGD